MADHDQPKPRILRRQFLAGAGAGLLSAGFLGCSESPSASTSPSEAPKGSLVLLGGGDQHWSLDILQSRAGNMTPEELDPTGMFRAILRQSGKAHPHVEILSNASRGYAHETGQELSLLFSALGASQAHYTAERDPQKLAYDSRLVERLQHADVVFVSGGDQEELTRLFRGTKAYRTLHERYANDAGFVLAGSSAGSAVMATHMIANNGPPRGRPKMDDGFSMLPIIVETHVDSHNRQNRERRLLQAVSSRQDLLGLGLDNATGLIIKDGQADVMGAGRVIAVLANGHALTLPEAHHVDVATLKDCADLEGLNPYVFRRGDHFSLGEFHQLAPPLAASRTNYAPSPR